MQRTNKYWELYRKYGDRSRRTANSKHANTCALEYSHSTHNIPESTVCVQRVLREYREFSSNAKNIVIISVDEKQPKKNTHETKAKRQQKKTYTHNISNNITRKRQCLNHQNKSVNLQPCNFGRVNLTNCSINFCLRRVP